MSSSWESLKKPTTSAMERPISADVVDLEERDTDGQLQLTKSPPSYTKWLAKWESEDGIGKKKSRFQSCKHPVSIAISKFQTVVPVEICGLRSCML